MDSHTRFEKTPACPTNEALLAYQRSQGGALTGRARGVAAHLAECEFCSLLLDLLRSHPVAEPTAHEPPPIPEDLRRLLGEELRHSGHSE
jgi:hypothetical protein